MLFFYFLKRFYTFFLSAFFGLTILFSLTHFYMRLPTVGSLQTIFVVFWHMLPLTTLFSFPIASCLAVQVTIAQIFNNHESDLLYFLFSARNALYKALLFFSISLCILYIPLVCEWGPRSYLTGKKRLLSVAKKELYQLAPKTMHTIFPGFSFYFKKKVFKVNQEPILDTLLLVFKKKHEYYLFSAKVGWVQGSLLFLKQGSMYNNAHNNKHYYATFDLVKMNLDTILNQEKNSSQSQILKFLDWKKLIGLKSQDKKAYSEFHKRIAQILWQFLFPFLGFFGFFIFRRRNTLIGSCLFSGLLFLVMYIFLTLGQFLMPYIGMPLFTFYIPPSMLFFVFMLFYQRHL